MTERKMLDVQMILPMDFGDTHSDRKANAIARLRLGEPRLTSMYPVGVLYSGPRFSGPVLLLGETVNVKFEATVPTTGTPTNNVEGVK